MLADCEVRAARDLDAEAISGVIVSALRGTNARDYPPEVIARIEAGFDPPAVLALIGKRQVFVASVEGLVVGTASLEGDAARTVFVAPDAQGRGIGRALMGAVERAAATAGVELLTVRSSVTAERFYARLGFRLVRDAYFGDERTIIMELRLRPGTREPT